MLSQFCYYNHVKVSKNINSVVSNKVSKWQTILAKEMHALGR